MPNASPLIGSVAVEDIQEGDQLWHGGELVWTAIADIERRANEMQLRVKYADDLTGRLNWPLTARHNYMPIAKSEGVSRETLTDAQVSDLVSSWEAAARATGQVETFPFETGKRFLTAADLLDAWTENQFLTWEPAADDLTGIVRLDVDDSPVDAVLELSLRVSR